MFNKKFMEKFFSGEDQQEKMEILGEQEYRFLENSTLDQLKNNFYQLHHQIMNDLASVTDKEKYLAVASLLCGSNEKHIHDALDRFVEHLDLAVHYKTFKTTIISMYQTTQGRDAMDRLTKSLGDNHTIISILKKCVPFDVSVQTMVL
jgi:hypothetical protein